MAYDPEHDAQCYREGQCDEEDDGTEPEPRSREWDLTQEYEPSVDGSPFTDEDYKRYCLKRDRDEDEHVKKDNKRLIEELEVERTPRTQAPYDDWGHEASPFDYEEYNNASFHYSGYEAESDLPLNIGNDVERETGDAVPEIIIVDDDSDAESTGTLIDESYDDSVHAERRADGELVGSANAATKQKSRRSKETDKTDTRQRGFVFTIFEPEKYPERLERLKALSKYGVYGVETCPTTGRKHLQGYIYTHEKISQQAMRNKCRTKEGSFFVEEQSKYSTIQQAVDYCKKEKQWTEWGICPAEPGRAKKQAINWQQALDFSKKGEFEKVDPRIHFLHRDKMEKHHSIASSVNIKTLTELDNYWLYGPAGSGKTQYVYNTYNPNEEEGILYIKGDNKWWDLYNGEPNVLVDDFAQRDRDSVRAMKHWGDKYAFMAESKGVTGRKIRPQRLLVTSNYHPRDIWTNHQDLEPIMRRFKIIKFSCEDGVYSHAAE